MKGILIGLLASLSVWGILLLLFHQTWIGILFLIPVAGYLVALSFRYAIPALKAVAGFLVALYLILFFRIKWMAPKDFEPGFYMVKRIWAWVLVLPVTLAGIILVGLFTEIKSWWGYNRYCVRSDNPKTTFKQRLEIRYRLL